MSSVFQTGWFVESLLSQTLIVYVIRTGKIPFKDSKPSLPLVMTTMLICITGIILPYTILGQQFQMTPMPSNYWYGLAVLLPCYLLLTQLVKMWFVKKWGIL
jgi:Mg2+-importing ATPase